MLAKVSNKQLGELLNASEISGDGNAFTDLIMETMKKMPQELMGAIGNYDLVYEKKFRFRFELK